MKDEFAILVQQAYEARASDDRGTAPALFQQAEKFIPLRQGVLLEIATEFLVSGRADEAEAIYDGILRTDPNHFGALVQHGHLARSRGDRLAALEDFQAAAAVEPGHIGVLLEVLHELRTLDRRRETR